jgi:DNA helicase-2/ATP-dependent DNA helicase PcrA
VLPEVGLEALQQVEEGDAEPEGLAKGSVSVTTFRKAKGLTAEVVVATDLDDDVVPGDVQGEDLAEQRRLLYVTMTRARRFLYLTHPSTRFGHPTSYAGAGHRAPGNYRQRSRFLDEVGIASQ